MVSARRHGGFDEAELPETHRIRWWLAAGVAGLVAAGFAVVPYLPFFQTWTFVRDPKVASVITWTVLQTSVVLVSVVLTLYFVGKARLEAAAYRANQIDIRLFADERPEGSHDREIDSAVELTATFKRFLNDSRLYTPTPVPGVGSSYDFIQIVEHAGDSADGWWKAATKLIRLAQPPAAFTVSGTIRPGNTSGRYQLILELVRVPRFAASPLVIEDENWARVLHRAANAVAALVIPRSAYVRTNIHWVAWRDAKIPYELFDAYQRANHFITYRRYDEALAEYYRAVSLDPANVYIRLEIAALQEQLDLHLDALATYDDVITVCSRGHPTLARWWIGPDFARQPRHDTRGREVALLIARYRHALVLGHGDSVAGSWWVRRTTAGVPGDARAQRRTELRAAIELRFRRYVDLDVRTQRYAIPREKRLALHRRVLRVPVEELVVQEATPAQLAEYNQRAAEMRSYLGALSQYEIERLIEDYRRFGRRWRRSWQQLTNRALDLSLVWAVLRRAMADIEPVTGAVPEPQPAYPGSRVRLADVCPDRRWPPDPRALDATVEAAGPRSSWEECYNAASVYAVAMLEVGPRGERDLRDRARNPRLEGEARDEVARRAVRELYQAATISHSGRLPERRSWVMGEDPDLAALRGHELFRVFEMVTFSPDRAAPLRPQRAHVWEQVSYVRQLVAEIAGCRAHFWRTRPEEPAPDSRTVDRRRAADRDAWRKLTALATGKQDWYTRYQAICAFREWSAESGYPGSISGFPLYSEERLHAQLRGAAGRRGKTGLDANVVVREYVRLCDQRLDQLVADIAELEHTLVAEDDYAARAQLWAALCSWFDDDIADGSSAGERRERFRKLARP
ncbi:tetratricopeptide repeat protein [Amycolatopsis sp. FBCC-B4732]|uniref:tetratricopeptide repeat protein n=1 Tax=Amycolatopsis sp. FBCC-B4732 TaxID=3079339 RepID=UPI001FF1A472|nr:tetratricopeptide repeat protein [Amycolatopsis sp. FBCC-B4732]UOX91266.1 tetratricopeptide repeat protein [Amycolatopsis sp. FBCC-B4732]